MEKILIFSSGSELYGSERGLLSLVDAIGDLYQITVVLPRNGPLADCLKQKGVAVMIFPLSILTLSLSPLYYMLSPFLFLVDLVFFGCYVFFQKIDRLHTNNLLIVFPSVIAMLLGKKHIWHMREFFPIEWVNQSIVRLAKASKSAVICQSQNIKDVLFAGDMGQCATVIYEGLTLDSSGLDATRSDEGFHYSPDTLVLSVIARIHPSKGQFELVKLLGEAAKSSRRKFVLRIVGDVLPQDFRGLIYKNKIERYVKRYNMENEVLFCGFRQDIPAVLGSTDICVFPFQRNEPFGLALLEALVFAKRVLITMNPGSREILGYFGSKYRELSLASVVEEIGKGKLPSAEAFVPDIFKFEYYKRSIRAFFSEPNQNGCGSSP